MPAGAISFDTLASPHDGGRYETIDLTAHTDKLAQGGNVLAVEVHQAAPNDSDLLWDAELVYLTDAIEPATEWPRITDVYFHPAIGLALEWNSEFGRQYVVQRSHDLILWTDITSPIPASGATMQFIDATAPSGVGWFYRVHLLE
jgi:hypothetical protein